jgi:hypothetical protein
MDASSPSLDALTYRREDFEFTLDRLLAEWFQWRQGYRFTRGYAGQDATCRDYRTPGHWDWKNGAAADRADELQVKAMDAAIERVPNLPKRWNTAIQFEARNLVSGAAVWTSPVLPRGDELEVLVLEARNLLLLELRREGIITPHGQ